MNQENPKPESFAVSGATQTDRYVSFKGIDCNAMAGRLLDILDLHLQDAARRNAFWDYFVSKRTSESGPRPDDLLLIHSYINQLREFFESCEDPEGLALLERLEEECC